MSRLLGSGGSPLVANDEGILQIGTTVNKFTDGFNGNAIDLEKWDIVRSVGITPVIAGGTLTLPLGTAAANEFLMVGKQDVSIPANIIASFSVSQRLAANEIRFGYLEVDDKGKPIAHATLPGQFRNYTAARLTGTSATVAQLDTMSTDAAVVKTVAATTGTSTGVLDYSLEARAEDVTLASQTADAATLRSAGSARISTQVPSPARRYRPFIWVKNNAVAATNTNVVISRIVSLDLQELQVEVGGGRGNAAASQAIPVVNAGTFAVTFSGQTTIPTASATASAGTADLKHKRLSTADTNLVNVKNAAGRIMGGIVTNTGASTRFLKLYNKASAPVVATDVPVLTIPIRAASELYIAQIVSAFASSFSLGIGYAITGAYGDTDATAIAAGEVAVNLIYV